MKRGDTVDIDEAVRGPCPCGGNFTAGYHEIGGERRPVVTHSAPPCTNFINLTTVGYLSWVRRSTRRRSPR